MTDEQKLQIGNLRSQGQSYGAIAEKLGLSLNTVKSFCKRHGYGGVVAQKSQEVDNHIFCLNCGKEVPQNPKRKKKRFCSDQCRSNWWNKHLDQVKRKANYKYICPVCNQPFTSYGNAKRKYCSHSCYIKWLWTMIFS